MTKIMYISFLLGFAMATATACQAPDEPAIDTDTTPDCPEGETAVVPWCEDADRMLKDLWCVQCGDEEVCAYEKELDFVCNILTSNHGKLSACVREEDAAHCQAEMTRYACDDEIYRWWQECDGFTE